MLRNMIIKIEFKVVRKNENLMLFYYFLFIYIYSQYNK